MTNAIPIILASALAAVAMAKDAEANLAQPPMQPQPTCDGSSIVFILEEQAIHTETARRIVNKLPPAFKCVTDETNPLPSGFNAAFCAAIKSVADEEKNNPTQHSYLLGLLQGMQCGAHQSP